MNIKIKLYIFFKRMNAVRKYSLKQSLDRDVTSILVISVTSASPPHTDQAKHYNHV